MKKVVILSLSAFCYTGCGSEPPSETSASATQDADLVSAPLNPLLPIDSEDSFDSFTNNPAQNTPDLHRYAGAFMTEAHRRGIATPRSLMRAFRGFQWVDSLPDRKTGWCHFNNDGTTRIELVKPSKWPIHPSQRQYAWAIFHELGHCVLGYYHTNDDPHAVMAPQFPSSEDLKLLAVEEKLDDFFSICPVECLRGIPLTFDLGI